MQQRHQHRSPERKNRQNHTAYIRCCALAAFSALKRPSVRENTWTVRRCAQIPDVDLQLERTSISARDASSVCSERFSFRRVRRKAKKDVVHKQQNRQVVPPTRHRSILEIGVRCASLLDGGWVVHCSNSTVTSRPVLEVVLSEAARSAQQQQQ